MSNVTYVHILHFAGANELKVICTLAVSSQAVEMLSKMESVHHDWCSTRCASSSGIMSAASVSLLSDWTLCRYGSQNKTDMLLETQQSKSYGGSWRRAGKIWMISNYKDTDISIWVMETFMVLVSGWLDCPVWVALERHWVRLQTISIPLDRGSVTRWEMAAVPCPLHRQGPMRRRPRWRITEEVGRHWWGRHKMDKEWMREEKWGNVKNVLCHVWTI